VKQVASIAGLIIYPEDGGDIFVRIIGCLINGLQGVVSQKIELFITTGVRTSNLT
jgi:hypothetical protein